MVQPPCISTGEVTSFYYKAYDMKLWLICGKLIIEANPIGKEDTIPTESVINRMPSLKSDNLATKESATADKQLTKDDNYCTILESIAPGCVKEFDGEKFINYAEVTTSLIKAIQELNDLSQTQQQQIEQLKERINSPVKFTKTTAKKIVNCTPNPTSGIANISYTIGQESQYAELLIVDLAGLSHKQYKLDVTETKTIIDLSSLKPGMYYGVLMVDGQRCDSYSIIKE